MGDAPDPEETTLRELVGPEAADRIIEARRMIDNEYARAGVGQPSDDIVAARHRIDDEFAQVIADVREHTDVAREQSVVAREQSHRTNRTVIILALAVICMLLVGIGVGAFLIVRNNDIHNIQDQIRAEVAKHEQKDIQMRAALCPVLLDVSRNPDKQLADDARASLHVIGCP